MIPKLRNWLDTKSKMLLFRIIILSVTLTTVASELGLLTLSTNTILVIFLGLFLIFTEVFLSETGKIGKLANDGINLEQNTLFPYLEEDALKAKEIIIVARTGESFFYTLRPTLERIKKLKLTIILTQSDDDGKDFIEYQEVWLNRWRDQFSDIQPEIFQARVSLELMGIIIDDKIGYLGFRKTKLLKTSSSKEFMRVSRITTSGIFLLDLYKNWIIDVRDKNQAAP